MHLGFRVLDVMS